MTVFFWHYFHPLVPRLTVGWNSKPTVDCPSWPSFDRWLEFQPPVFLPCVRSVLGFVYSVGNSWIACLFRASRCTVSTDQRQGTFEYHYHKAHTNLVVVKVNLFELFHLYLYLCIELFKYNSYSRGARCAPGEAKLPLTTSGGLAGSTASCVYKWRSAK